MLDVVKKARRKRNIHECRRPSRQIAAEIPAGFFLERTDASMVHGPHRQELRTFFANEIPDELTHAQILADKIAALGGTPAAEPAPVSVVFGAKGMIEAALTAEVDTIKRYRRRARPRLKPPESTAWLRSSTR